MFNSTKIHKEKPEKRKAKVVVGPESTLLVAEQGNRARVGYIEQCFHLE